MREIKFRGWHTVKKVMFSAEEMTADQLTLLPTGQFINVNGRSTRMSEIYPQDKFIPLQYTGLKDKNGKEIYEGDIIRWKESHGCSITTVVEWQLQTGFSPFMQIEADCEDYFIPRDMEVLGNIYENPELLEEKGNV